MSLDRNISLFQMETSQLKKEEKEGEMFFVLFRIWSAVESFHKLKFHFWLFLTVNNFDLNICALKNSAGLQQSGYF